MLYSRAYNLNWWIFQKWDTPQMIKMLMEIQPREDKYG